MRDYCVACSRTALRRLQACAGRIERECLNGAEYNVWEQLFRPADRKEKGGVHKRRLKARSYTDEGWLCDPNYTPAARPANVDKLPHDQTEWVVPDRPQAQITAALDVQQASQQTPRQARRLSSESRAEAGRDGALRSSIKALARAAPDSGRSDQLQSKILQAAAAVVAHVTEESETVEVDGEQLDIKQLLAKYTAVQTDHKKSAARGAVRAQRLWSDEHLQKGLRAQTGIHNMECFQALLGLKRRYFPLGAKRYRGMNSIAPDLLDEARAQAAQKAPPAPAAGLPSLANNRKREDDAEDDSDSLPKRRATGGQVQIPGKGQSQGQGQDSGSASQSRGASRGRSSSAHGRSRGRGARGGQGRAQGLRRARSSETLEGLRRLVEEVSNGGAIDRARQCEIHTRTLVPGLNSRLGQNQLHHPLWLAWSTISSGVERIQRQLKPGVYSEAASQVVTSFDDQQRLHNAACASHTDMEWTRFLDETEIEVLLGVRKTMTEQKSFRVGSHSGAELTWDSDLLRPPSRPAGLRPECDLRIGSLNEMAQQTILSISVLQPLVGHFSCTRARRLVSNP